MELDDEICLCFHVSKRKILNFIRVEQPRVTSQISGCFGAGTGCGWCRATLKRYHEAALAGGQIQPDETTPEEYARGRTAYVRAGKGTPPPGAAPLVDEE